MQFINFLRTATMRLGLSGSKVAIKSFVFSIGLVAEKQQFYATRLSDFHELSRAASPWGQLWQFWQLWQSWQFNYPLTKFHFEGCSSFIMQASTTRRTPSK